MGFSRRSSGVVAMSAGGLMLVAALLGVGVAGTVSASMLILAGFGFVVFVAGAALHDQGSARPPPPDGIQHISDLDL